MQMDAFLTQPSLCSRLGPETELLSLRRGKASGMCRECRWGFPAFPGCSSLSTELRPREEQGREGMRNLLLQLGKQVGAELKASG